MSSRRIIACIIIGLSVLGSLLLSFFLKGENPPLEATYYSFQIISAIFVIAGVVIAVWQYTLTVSRSRTELDVSRVQRAIDLANYYKDHVLDFFPAIRYVFERVGLTSELTKVGISSINDFDNHELHELFDNEALEKLKKIDKNPDFCKAVIESNVIYDLSFDIRLLTALNSEDSKDMDVNPLAYAAFMRNLVNTVLNNLEFFAMHFTHHTADESVIYQSLHQSYLEMVQLLYYFIANVNDNPSDKYYTNVIELFIKWRSRRNEQNADLANKSRSIASKGTIVQG